MNTENNTNDSRNRLSEMDKVFIPADLDENVDIEDLMNYKQTLGFWRTVPKNYSLVKQNVFTQEVSNVEGFGIKLVAPLFIRTILVSRHTGIKKYTNMSAFSKDGIELKLDINVTMRISNPAEYVVEGKNQKEHLDAIITELLRRYVSSIGFENVVAAECRLSLLDPRGELDDFSEQYGIKIEKVLIEKVTLPEALRKLYNDTAEENQKRNAQLIRLTAEKEKAENDASISEINAKAKATEINIVEKAKASTFADKLAKVAVALKKEGFTEEQIAQAIRTHMIAETGNVIYMGDNQEAKNIAAGITGGNQANTMTRTRTK